MQLDDPVIGLQLEKRVGSVDDTAFAGNPKTATVTVTAFPDANYRVFVTCVGNNFVPHIETGQTATQFTINLNANNISGLDRVEYLAIQDGEE